jgi:UPF0716 protein FxsA
MRFTGSSGCLWKLLALFILVPLAELWVLLVLARHTSIWVALLVVIVTGVAGTLLVKTQGWRTMRRITEELQRGRLPTDALLDASMILGAGVLLLTPGLLTDALGISLLIPCCRRRYRQAVVAWIRKHTHIQSWAGTPPDARSEIVDAYVIAPPDDEPPPP